VAQGVGPEFKHQYCKKKKKNNKNLNPIFLDLFFIRRQREAYYVPGPVWVREILPGPGLLCQVGLPNPTHW
jgi:hypothetical protein